MQTPTGQQQRTDVDSGPVSQSGARFEAVRGYRPGPESGGPSALGPGSVPSPPAHTAVPALGPGPDPVLDPGADPDPVSGPVFVDASGRRRKLARRASLAAVAVLAGYVGLLAVSFAGGPIPPKALLPVPGIPAGRQQAPSSAPVNAAVPSAKPGAGHGTDSIRPTAGGTEHRTETRASTSSGSAGQSAPSQPLPTSSAATSAVPPTPTGTTAASTHGNPTPPGRSRHSSASPT